jgi:hypothetical protein
LVGKGFTPEEFLKKLAELQGGKWPREDTQILTVITGARSADAEFLRDRKNMTA